MSFGFDFLVRRPLFTFISVVVLLSFVSCKKENKKLCFKTSSLGTYKMIDTSSFEGCNFGCPVPEYEVEVYKTACRNTILISNLCRITEDREETTPVRFKTSLDGYKFNAGPILIEQGDREINSVKGRFSSDYDTIYHTTWYYKWGDAIHYKGIGVRR